MKRGPRTGGESVGKNLQRNTPAKRKNLQRSGCQSGQKLWQQMQLLSEVMEGSHWRKEIPVRATDENDKVKLSKADDLEYYLLTFKRMMAVYKGE